MKVEYSQSFFKSLKKLKNAGLNTAVAKLIKKIESAQKIQDISSIKKLKGFDDYYRIRVGDYRIGCKLIGDIVWLAVVDDRKDIYKNFP